jgi:hypothetical protein
MSACERTERFIDWAGVSDEREKLAKELEAARARIARLEQEAETNRAFFARTLQTAHEAPRPGGGPTVWHVLAWVVGVGCGVLLTLVLLVARGEPPPMAPLPPPRPKGPLAASGRDASVEVADAGRRVPSDAGAAAVAPRAEPPRRPDDSGTLNVTATSKAVVFVDGKALGPAPVHGWSVKPGEHVVRVACASDAGLQAERKVDVPPFAEVDVEHRCE